MSSIVVLEVVEKSYLDRLTQELKQLRSKIAQLEQEQEQPSNKKDDVLPTTDKDLMAGNGRELPWYFIGN